MEALFCGEQLANDLGPARQTARAALESLVAEPAMSAVQIKIPAVGRRRSHNTKA